MPSPLKWQTRVVSCFPNATGFAVGSVEGRVAIQCVPLFTLHTTFSSQLACPSPRYIEEKDSSSNFSFKCHRQDQGGSKDQQGVYAVNAITFHQGYGTFSTAGSDGTINFWDKDSKTRLKSKCPGFILSPFLRLFGWLIGISQPSPANRVPLRPLRLAKLEQSSPMQFHTTGQR